MSRPLDHTFLTHVVNSTDRQDLQELFLRLTAIKQREYPAGTPLNRVLYAIIEVIKPEGFTQGV